MTDHPLEPTLETEARIAELFSHLPPPEIPAELRDESFLGGVYQRAAAAESASLGPILSATMTPQVVPDDEQWDAVTWDTATLDAEASGAEGAAIRQKVAAALPADPGPAPGVLSDPHPGRHPSTAHGTTTGRGISLDAPRRSRDSH